MKKKVILGLSGGVDSSVAAIRLMQLGYDTEAIFMRNWDSAANNDLLGNPDLKNDICPQELDYNDALRVSEQLNIKLHRIDFVTEYWDYVFAYFLDEYKKGRTPNPDIMCNKEIKFKAFLNEACKLGADYIAMGHYAKVRHDENISYLIRGEDQNKDQTYFLAFISQSQLQKALFPIGDMQKSEVRKLALDYNLATASKKDSTGICFIGERNFKEFLKNYLPAKKGKMMTLDNKHIMDHDGLMYYTIGQRKGLGIGGLNDYSNEPWFVIGKNLQENTLIVGQGYHNEYLYSNNCLATNMNWISQKPTEGKVYQAKFRYRSADSLVTITYIDNDTIKVNYPEKVRAVTPGQAVVIYDNEICLGGAIIDRVYMDDKQRKY